MQVAIAGGGGFVGLSIAEAILAVGHKVRLVDIIQPPEAALHYLGEHAGRGALEVQIADVTDAKSTKAALDDVDAVVLAAAVTSGTERERERPHETLAVNVMGFTALLEAARAAGAKRVINLSSASAYGASGFAGEGPMVEDQTWPKPDSLYGVSKLASEGIVARLAGLWDMDMFSVRLSGVYGPWERDTGRRDTLSPHLQAARIMLAGEEAVLPRPCTRDWTDSREIARAILGLLTAKRPTHPLYNISCGHEWTVADWLDALVEARPSLKWRLAEAGEAANVDVHGDLDRRPLSCARLADDIGVSLDMTPLDSAKGFLNWADATHGYWKT
jgi:nucleoside-diphosphate-sugar epimerase